MDNYRSIIYKIKLVILGILSFTILFGFIVNTFLIGALIFFWIIEGNYKEKLEILRERRIYLLYIALFVIYLIGIFYSSDLIEAWKYLEVKLFLLIMPIIVGTLKIKNRKIINRYIILYIAGAVTAVLVCYINATYQYYHNRIWTAFTMYRFPNILNIHRASFALAIAFAIVLLLDFILKKEIKIFIKILLIFLIGFLLYTIVILGSRVPVLALPIAINVMLLVYFLSKPRVLIFSLYFVIINLFVGVIAYFALNDVLFEHFLVMKTDVRADIWVNSISIIKDNPIFGYGIGDVQEVLSKSYKENGLVELMNQYLNAHNQYLQIWLEVGLIGLTILLLNLFKPLWEALRKKDAVIIAFIALVGFCFLSESYLNRFSGVLFYGFLINILTLRLYVPKE